MNEEAIKQLFTQFIRLSPSTRAIGLVSQEGLVLVRETREPDKNTEKLEFETAQMLQDAKQWWSRLAGGELQRIILSGEKIHVVVFSVTDSIGLYLETTNALNLNWLQQNMTKLIGALKAQLLGRYSTDSNGSIHS